MHTFGYSKYGSKKTEVDGHMFDSIKESVRYSELKLMERAGVIRDLKLQPEFILQDPFVYFGEKIRPIKYVGDFAYFDCETQRDVIEDVKGMILPEFKLKAKLFKCRFPHLFLLIT